MTKEATDAVIAISGWVWVAVFFGLLALVGVWMIVKGVIEKRREKLGLEECPRCGEYHTALEYHLRRCRGRPKSLLVEKRWKGGRRG